MSDRTQLKFVLIYLGVFALALPAWAWFSAHDLRASAVMFGAVLLIAGVVILIYRAKLAFERWVSTSKWHLTVRDNLHSAVGEKWARSSDGRSAFLDRLQRVGQPFVAILLIVAVLAGANFAFEQFNLSDRWENWFNGDPYLKVWVNPEAKVYYAPGNKAFGNTLPGFYVSQGDARAAGHRSTNSWNIGYGTNERPLATLKNLDGLRDSTIAFVNGELVLLLHNKSEMEVREVIVQVRSDPSSMTRTYRLTGVAASNVDEIWRTVAETPSGKWTWSFAKVRGVKP